MGHVTVTLFAAVLLKEAALALADSSLITSPISMPSFTRANLIVSVTLTGNRLSYFLRNRFQMTARNSDTGRPFSRKQTQSPILRYVFVCVVYTVVTYMYLLTQGMDMCLEFLNIEYLPLKIDWVKFELIL